MVLWMDLPICGDQNASHIVLCVQHSQKSPASLEKWTATKLLIVGPSVRPSKRSINSASCFKHLFTVWKKAEPGVPTVHAVWGICRLLACLAQSLCDLLFGKPLLHSGEVLFLQTVVQGSGFWLIIDWTTNVLREVPCNCNVSAVKYTRSAWSSDVLLFFSI